MIEKIKKIFAWIGAFCTAAIAVLVGFFFGKRNGNYRTDAGAMGTVKDEFKTAGSECAELGKYQSESGAIIAESKSIIDDCKSIIDEVEKRNSKRKN